MTMIRTDRDEFGDLEVIASDERFSGRVRLTDGGVNLRGDFAGNPLPAEVVPLLIAALAALHAANGDTQ